MTYQPESDSACDADTLSLSKSAVKIGKLGAIYVFGQAAPLLVGMLLLPVFTHYLVPAQMGIVALAAQVAMPLGLFVQLGLWPALGRQYFRIPPSQRTTLVRTILFGQTIQTLLLCVLLSVAGLWLADVLLPNLRQPPPHEHLPLGRAYVFALWLMVVWGCFFGALVQLGAGVTQLQERAGASVGISSLLYLLKAGLGVAVVVGLGWQGFGRQGAIFVATAIAAAVSLRVVWRHAVGHFDRAIFRQLLLSGLSFLPHSFSGILALTANAWLLNRLVSSTALGIYGIAINFAQLMEMVLPVLGSAAYPTQAELMRDGSPRAKTQQARLYTLMIVGIAGWALGIWLFAPIVIPILTAAQYHEAAQVVPILVFAWLLHALYIVVAQPVAYHGGGLWLSTVTVSSIVVSVGLGLWLIPAFGCYGAAWAMVACFATRCVVCSAVAYRLCPLPWQISKILRTLAWTVLLAVVGHWLLPPMPLVWEVAAKVALLLALPPGVWALGVVSTAEVGRAKQIVLAKLRTLLPGSRTRPA